MKQNTKMLSDFGHALRIGRYLSQTSPDELAGYMGISVQELTEMERTGLNISEHNIKQAQNFFGRRGIHFVKLANLVSKDGTSPAYTGIVGEVNGND